MKAGTWAVSREKTRNHSEQIETYRTRTQSLNFVYHRSSHVRASTLWRKAHANDLYLIINYVSILKSKTVPHHKNFGRVFVDYFD